MNTFPDPSTATANRTGQRRSRVDHTRAGCGGVGAARRKLHHLAIRVEAGVRHVEIACSIDRHAYSSTETSGHGGGVPPVRRRQFHQAWAGQTGTNCRRIGRHAEYPVQIWHSGYLVAVGDIRTADVRRRGTKRNLRRLGRCRRSGAVTSSRQSYREEFHRTRRNPGACGVKVTRTVHVLPAETVLIQLCRQFERCAKSRLLAPCVRTLRN